MGEVGYVAESLAEPGPDDTWSAAYTSGPGTDGAPGATTPEPVLPTPASGTGPDTEGTAA